jgi:hypothetical protein
MRGTEFFGAATDERRLSSLGGSRESDSVDEYAYNFSQILAIKHIRICAFGIEVFAVDILGPSTTPHRK